MRHLMLILISTLLVLFTACGGGGDSEKSVNNDACGAIGLPTRIIGGNTCGSTDTAAVVRIMAVVDTGSSLAPVPICSGSLVTQDVVLTAAHCFISKFGDYKVVGLGAYIGEPGAGYYVPGVKFSVAPSYSFDATTKRFFDDAALIKLESQLSNPVFPLLATRIPEIGEDGFVYGYGIRSTELNSGTDDFAKLQAGKMKIANVTQNHIFVFFSGKGVNVCNGDSGGPIVVMVDGQPALAGITSQGTTEKCSAGDVTTFTNIHSPGVLDWLIRNIPSAPVRATTSILSNDFVDYEELTLQDNLE